MTKTLPDTLPPILCNECNKPVSIRNGMAKALARMKGITCDKCRRDGRKWTRRTYSEYLETDHWKRFGERALKHYEHKCYLCGQECQPELHHNDYSRLGDELLSDVIPLCRGCHQAFEDYKRGCDV